MGGMVGGIIQGATAIVGGKQQAGAAQSAANVQAAQADASNKLQWQMLQQTRADNMTQNVAGQNAIARMMEEMGFGVLPTGNVPGYTGSTIEPGGSLVKVEGADGWVTPSKRLDKALGTDKLFGKFGGLFYNKTADPAGELLGIHDKNPDAHFWTPGAVQNTQMFSFTPKGGAEKLFSGFQADPSYAFRKAEGEKALNNSLAARGGLLSGSAVKAGQRYASDLASQEYGNYWNRLAQLAGYGAQSTGTTSQANQNFTNAISNGMYQGANARASGYAAVGQANANMLNEVGNAFGGMFGGGSGGSGFGSMFGKKGG